MSPSVTIGSLPRAFELMKAMQGQGLEWGEGYRGLGREAIAAILAGQMRRSIDEHLERMAELDQADRRNGSYRRHLLTELGEIELAVPRTRRFADRSAARLCPTGRASRPHDPCLLRARSVDPQSR